jgi:ribosomal protein S12 methylthiotransferase
LVVELKQLARKHDAWVRLHYVYPYPHVDDIIPLMADFSEFGNGILPYLDVPLQHSHPDVLKRMKRPASGEKNLERIAAWREICPDLIIRSTFIAGFPGETEEEFAHLLDFLEQAQIDRAGCFAYSPVDGAVANELPGAIEQSVREARQAKFMEIAEAVSIKRLKNKVGKRVRVIVDSVSSEGGIGRTAGDAPEIDGLVQILPSDRPSKRYRSGELIKVTVIDAQGHDLVVQM